MVSETMGKTNLLLLHQLFTAVNFFFKKKRDERREAIKTLPAEQNDGLIFILSNSTIGGEAKGWVTWSLAV